jgi:hypothetical protein
MHETTLARSDRELIALARSEEMKLRMTCRPATPRPGLTVSASTRGRSDPGGDQMDAIVDPADVGQEICSGPHDDGAIGPGRAESTAR